MACGLLGFRLAASRFSQFAGCSGAPSHRPPKAQDYAIMGDYSRDLRPVEWGQGLVCTAAIPNVRFPLWVKSRHRGISNQCPLYPQKRTWELSRDMSALCQKRTSIEFRIYGP